MNQTKLQKIFSFIIPVTLIFLAGTYFVTHAQTTVESSAGLSISPPTFELSANPGETITNTIRVENLTNAPLSLAIDRRNFTALGEAGSVELTEEETSFSLASWIEIEPRELVIEPRAIETFEFQIVVPPNAEPGGHFGSLVFRTNVRDTLDQTGAVVSQELGSLILLRIAGDIEESATYASFETGQNFYEYGPVDFAVRYQNTGNVHVRPAGTITITDMLGREVEKITLDQRNVLPEAIRRVDATWETEWGFGRYQATVAATYGSEQQVITSTTTFWILPYKVVGGVVLVVLIFSVVAFRARKRIKLALQVLSAKEE